MAIEFEMLHAIVSFRYNKQFAGYLNRQADFKGTHNSFAYNS